MVNGCILVHEYAPEFDDTALDIPDTMVETSYFNTFVSEMKLINNFNDVLLAHKVINSGLANRWGCRIPVKSNWKIDNFSQLLNGYEDEDVLEWLRYGFPISWDDSRPHPTPTTSNHLGATLFPEHVDK